MSDKEDYIEPEFSTKGGGVGGAAGKMLSTLEELELPDDLTDKQKEVLKLRLRGLSQNAIAKVLGVTQPVVSKHLRIVRQKMERDGKSVNQHVIVGESLNLFTEVEQRAWELYYLAKSKDKLNDANKALQLVLQARDKGLTLLMELGLMKRASVEHVHSVVSPLVKEWQENTAQKRLLVDQVISTQLKELDEPVPPEEDDIIDGVIVEAEDE